ncbi:hypothetical protein RB213_015496 [Colletotrichum asianum]
MPPGPWSIVHCTVHNLRIPLGLDVNNLKHGIHSSAWVRIPWHKQVVVVYRSVSIHPRTAPHRLALPCTAASHQHPSRLHIAAHLPSLVFRLVPCPALACPHLSGLTRLLDPNEGSELLKSSKPGPARLPARQLPPHPFLRRYVAWSNTSPSSYCSARLDSTPACGGQPLVHLPRPIPSLVSVCHCTVSTPET